MSFLNFQAASRVGLALGLCITAVSGMRGMKQKQRAMRAAAAVYSGPTEHSRSIEMHTPTAVEFPVISDEKYEQNKFDRSGCIGMRARAPSCHSSSSGPAENGAFCQRILDKERAIRKEQGSCRKILEWAQENYKIIQMYGQRNKELLEKMKSLDDTCPANPLPKFFTAKGVVGPGIKKLRKLRYKGTGCPLSGNVEVEANHLYYLNDMLFNLEDISSVLKDKIQWTKYDLLQWFEWKEYLAYNLFNDVMHVRQKALTLQLSEFFYVAPVKDEEYGRSEQFLQKCREKAWDLEDILSAEF